MAGGLGVTGLAGYLIYKACGKNKMTEDQLESKIKSVLAEFKIDFDKKIQDQEFLTQLTSILAEKKIDLEGIISGIQNNGLKEEDVKLILSKITKKDFQQLLDICIPAELSSRVKRVKLEHVDNKFKKFLDSLLNIEGFKVGVTSDVLFNSLVLVLTIVVSFVVYEASKSDGQGEKIFDFDLDTNTLKFTKKVEDNDINDINNMISAFKQLNSSEGLVNFLGSFGVPYVKLLGDSENKPLIELLLKGIKGINFEFKNSFTISFTLNSDESLTIKMLNGDNVMLQWSIQKA